MNSLNYIKNGIDLFFTFIPVLMYESYIKDNEIIIVCHIHDGSIKDTINDFFNMQDNNVNNYVTAYIIVD